MTRQECAVSDEDKVEIWEGVKKETMNKVRENKGRTTGTEPPRVREEEVEKTGRVGGK